MRFIVEHPDITQLNGGMEENIDIDNKMYDLYQVR